MWMGWGGVTDSWQWRVGVGREGSIRFVISEQTPCMRPVGVHDVVGCWPGWPARHWRCGMGSKRGAVLGLSGREGRIDLRWARERRGAEGVLARASGLLPVDRALLESVLEDGRSVASVAALMGEPAWRVRRRVHRLLDRIGSALFAFVAVRGGAMPADQRRVAMACFVEGRTIREAARVLGLSFHRARTLALTTRLECEAFERARRVVDRERLGCALAGDPDGGVAA